MRLARIEMDAAPSERALTARPRRIVVALDGTPFAESALPTAVALGRAGNAEVVLMRAHSGRVEAPRNRLGLRRHERETLARASLYLARIEQDLRAKGVRTLSHSPVGPAVDALAAVAAEECDVIVLATHAGGGLARTSQMSVAREVALRTRVPLLLLSNAARGLFAARSGAPTFNVVLSGEARDAALLRAVGSLARMLAGQVVAYRSVNGPAGEPWADGGDERAADAAAYLETVRARLTESDLATWTVLVEGDPLAELARLPDRTGEVVALSIGGTPGRREAGVDAALALLRRAGGAVLLVPQAPGLALVPDPLAGRIELGTGGER